MYPSKEIRRKQKPLAFKQETQWFAKGFHQPKTKREINAATIDAFQAMIWDKPLDDILPTYGEYICFFPVSSFRIPSKDCKKLLWL